MEKDIMSQPPPGNICVECGATDALWWVCKRCSQALLKKWKQEGVWSRELPHDGP